MIIVINKNDLSDTKLCISKRKASQLVDVHYNTLINLPYQNKDYYILDYTPIKTLKKGYFK